MSTWNALSQPIAETGSDATENRQQQLEQLYCNNYDCLLDTALTDSSLYVADGERILEELERALPKYDGQLTDEAFTKWGEAIIQPAIARIAAFAKLKAENSRYVYDGIWKVLSEAIDLMDDYTVRDISDKVWSWAIEHLEELLKPGTAKLSTRLHKKAYWQARAWRTARLRARERFIQLEHSRDGGLGQLVPTEESETA